ncbi:FAD binding domain-containing protein [Candidatus Bipolaricaulota bacterium]|nr:FAD binding domain-containing protein [Candidatus Bipolaricaulota bacterium]
MTSVQTYQRPSSIEEAWRLLNEGGKSAKLVGGGVDVALFAPPEIIMLIDLADLPNRSIEMRDGELVMGAGVTLTELLESPLTAGYLDGIVATMLRQVASPLLRNAASVGGALASTHPWSDVITLFLALGARVTQYAGRLQTVLLDELLEGRGIIDRAIITEVILPVPADRTYVSFEKFVRTGFDVGMLNCACRLTMGDDGCEDVRIVFGGTPDIGHRLEAVENAVNEERLDQAAIESAAVLASEVIPARDDVRASADYRRVLAAVGIRRCFTRIAQRAGE